MHDVHYSSHDENKYKVSFAGSREFEKISSLNFPKGKPFPKNKREEHYATNNSYGEIFYDPYRRLYYRFAHKALDNFEGNLYKKRILILLDEDLNYVSEIDLGELTEYMIYSFGVFVTEEGLNLQVLSDSEDEILIYRINIIKDEN